MTCCCPCAADDTDKTKPTPYDKSFKGPVQSGRSCTDIICCLLFFVSVIIFIVLGLIAWLNGNPETLLFPMNSAGGICKDNTPYLQMFDFTKCANLNPTTLDSFSSLQCPTPSICVAECPNEFTITIPVQGFTGNLTCDVGVVPADPSTVQGVQDLIQQLAEDKCIKYTIPSQPVLNRCLPKIPASNIVDITSTFVTANGDSITTPDGSELNPEILSKAVDIFNSAMSYQEFFNKILSDLQNSWHWILVGLGVALIMSFVFMFFIRCLVGPVIYLLMVIIVGALGFGCYFTFTRWKELEALDSEQGAIWENAMTWRNIFIICVVSEVILTLLFIFCISRVRIAVEVISQASTAVWSNLSTLFFPVVTSVMIIVCIAYWAMVSLFLVASREATQCVGIGRKSQIFLVL